MLPPEYLLLLTIRTRCRLKNHSAQRNLDVLIIEDSLSYALELERICKILGLNVLDTIGDSARALEAIFADSPDLILMDIEINGKLSGLDIGKQINHLEIPILYITSFGNESVILEAQKSNMVGFLVKPISDKEIFSKLKEIMDVGLNIKEEGDFTIVERNEKQRTLFFMKNNVYQKVEVHDVCYVQSEDNYCRFFLLDNSQFLTRITMSEVEQITSKFGFFRCHRRYIVNSQAIEAIDTTNNSVLLQGDVQIAFSRSRKEEILKLGIFLK